MSGISESFSSGVIFQYSAVLSMFLSSSLFYFLLAHILPTSVVGSISLMYAIMNIAAVVFVFGLSQGIQHFVSYHLARNNNEEVRKLIRRTTIITFILGTLAFFGVYYASPSISNLFFHSSGYIPSLRILSIAISMSVVINIFAAMLLGLNQYKGYSIIYTFVYIFTYFFPLLLFYVLKNPYYLIMGLSIANTINATGFIIAVYRKYAALKTHDNYTINVHNELYKNIILYSLPLFFSSVMNTSASYIDRIVVSYFLHLSNLGIYNFALIIASAAAIIVSPISNLLLPKLSSFFSLKNMDGFKSSIRMLLNIVSLIYIPAALGIAALSKMILYEFAGPAYVMAYLPLMVIMFVTSFFIGSNVLSSGIASVRKTRIFVYSSAFALSANIILSILLIPRFNIIGAAISYSSMNAVNFFIVYHYARKYGISNYDFNRTIKIWIASIIMFITIFTIQFYFPYSMLNIFAYIIFGTLIYVVEIKVFRLISRDEMDYIVGIIPDKLSLLKYFLTRLAFTEKSVKRAWAFKFLK